MKGRKTQCSLWLYALGFVLIVTRRSIADALSLRMSIGNPRPLAVVTRRHILAACVVMAPLSAVDATCLSGDVAPDCIGVYKERIPLAKEGENQIVMGYGAFRPDRPPVVLTNPTSFDEALGMLKDQCLALDDIERLVKSGELQDAGLLLLRLLPNITVAGRYVVANKFAPQSQSMLEQTEELVASVDKMILRGLRGKMGTTAVAQMQILSELSSAKLSLDNLIKTVTSGT